MYDLVADLPLHVEGYDLHGLAQPLDDWTRRTTIVRLYGGEHDGLGEDVNYAPDEQLELLERGSRLPLAGRYSLAELSSRFDELGLFEGEPALHAYHDYRRWAFESAALDLALRQAGVSLADQLAHTPRPVRFVASMHLEDEAGLERLRKLLSAQPDLGVKLDATPLWSGEIVAELAATQAVRVVDFKGAYIGTPVDVTPDPQLYQRVVEHLPEALLEDPHADDECRRLLAPHQDRVTWDAPIHSVEDIRALEHEPRVINFKPSRFGTIERLFDAYDYCGERDIAIYGGGQFELGIGRGQIQYLASLLHADAANDVAPSAYNTEDDFARLPASPLPASLDAIGFRWR